MKSAEIVSVGTEILMGQITDTNAQVLGALFPELGIAHYHRQTVGDNLERLTAALKLALSRSDIVITIGGLGPTQDDMTRDGIAAALGDPLILDERVAEQLRKGFAIRKLTWTDSQHRQAQRPSCGRPIPNPYGSAPGLICEKNGKSIIALPGPKNEFVPMAHGPVREYLTQFSGNTVIHSRLLRVCGIGEGAIEDRIKDLLSSTNPSVAPYAKTGEVHLRVTASAATVEEAEKIIAPVEGRIRELLESAVYGVDETTLEEAVLEMLRKQGETLAVAESITGGWLGQRITGVPGSSEVFLGGVISYSSEIKAKELGVERRLLNDPVSAEVATQMAEGVREKFGATYGVALTGNAGPTVDAGGKPVGLTYIAVAGPGGTRVEEYRLRGIRDDIRFRATQFALTLLLRVVLGAS